MITLNRTFEEISGFYTKVVLPMECLLFDMAENYFVRHLDGTNEDEPQVVNIQMPFDTEPTSVVCPTITKMWVDEDSAVLFQYEGDDIWYALSTCSPYQVMCLLQTYSQNYEHLCDTNND